MARDRPFQRVLPPSWRNSIDADTTKALTAELLGTALFVLLSNLTTSPLATGISYAVTSYATSPLSGGHLNPVISLAYAISNHMHWALTGEMSIIACCGLSTCSCALAFTTGMYVVSQLLGGILGAILEGLLLPHIHLGHNKHGHVPGCFYPSLGTNWLRLLIWEFLMTLLFLAVVYSVTVARDRFSSVGPLAAGLAIYVAIDTAGGYTGAVINPARLFGASVVFLCAWKHFWFYILGHLLAAFTAAAITIAHFGKGPAYDENRDDLDGRLGERLMPEGGSSDI